MKRETRDLSPHGIPEVPQIGRYAYARASAALASHAHRGALEICFLAKGTQLYRVAQKDYVMRGGDVFLTFPGEVHSTGEAPQEKGVLYWLQVRLPGRGCGFFGLDASDSRALADALGAIPHRHFGGEPHLARALDEILELATHRPRALGCLMIRVRLLGFLLAVVACAKKDPKPAISAAVNDVLHHIEANTGSRLPLSSLAERCGLSLPRFKARFADEIGIPPAEYVQRKKVAEAKRLLAGPGRSVTEIAFEMGFTSSQYFATVFSRYTGITPSRFRAASRECRR